MANWVINQTVDLQQGTQQPQIVPDALMVAGDDMAHTWRIQVKNNGQDADLSGLWVRGYFERSDGETAVVAGSISGSVVEVTMSSGCYHAPGRLTGSVQLHGFDSVVTLAMARFYVHPPKDGVALGPDELQIDFVSAILNYSQPTKLYAKKYERWPDVGFIHALVPISGSNRYVRYGIERTYQDPYIRLGVCSVVSLEEQIVEKERKNYDSRTGTWVVLDENNEYTTTIGDTFTVSFTGTKIEFLHKADDQGGLWEFELDGVQTVQKHCYSPTGVNPRRQTLWDVIAPGPHTGVGTFLGADPSYPVATPRGYISVADPDDPEIYHKTTFRVYNAELDPVEIFEVMPTSNKELAVAAAPTGLTPQFMPSHSGNSTMSVVSQKVYIDGVEVTEWADGDPVEVESIEVVQDMLGTHTETPGDPMASIKSVHKITKDGVYIKVYVKFLQAVDFHASYGMMFPANNDFATKLITGGGLVYDAYSSAETVNETIDESPFYTYVNRGGTDREPDIVAAVSVDNKFLSYREGAVDRGDPFMLFQHRDIQKVYPVVFKLG
ncbi:MAG: hypothetical protein PHX74_12495, partial [Candidatus Sumerlaeales bacterium]|nr:hypothetical protein [Candidatus Sumerlaeales bacterium]